MFTKLEDYVKADPELLNKMKESGIDINRKLYDYLNGLYVLAVKAYQDNSLDIASSFIDRFEAAVNAQPATSFENLRIAAGNIKSLIFWEKDSVDSLKTPLKRLFTAIVSIRCSVIFCAISGSSCLPEKTARLQLKCSDWHAVLKMVTLCSKLKANFLAKTDKWIR